MLLKKCENMLLKHASKNVSDLKRQIKYILAKTTTKKMQHCAKWYCSIISTTKVW